MPEWWNWQTRTFEGRVEKSVITSYSIHYTKLYELVAVALVVLAELAGGVALGLQRRNNFV